MKNRICDLCKKEIVAHIEYIKCSKYLWDGKKLTSSSCGDLCIKCWEKIKNEKTSD